MKNKIFAPLLVISLCSISSLVSATTTTTWTTCEQGYINSVQFMTQGETPRIYIISSEADKNLDDKRIKLFGENEYATRINGLENTSLIDGLMAAYASQHYVELNNASGVCDADSKYYYLRTCVAKQECK